MRPSANWRVGGAGGRREVLEGWSGREGRGNRVGVGGEGMGKRVWSGLRERCRRVGERAKEAGLKGERRE